MVPGGIVKIHLRMAAVVLLAGIASCGKSPSTDGPHFSLIVLGHDAATKEWTMETDDLDAKQRISYVVTCTSFSGVGGKDMERGPDACSLHVGETLAESLKRESWMDINIDNSGTMSIVSGYGPDREFQLLQVNSAHVLTAPR
jgi:hypothetical protein